MNYLKQIQGKLFIKMSGPEKESKGYFSSPQALGPCENKQMYISLWFYTS